MDQGKPWNENIEKQVKSVVSKCISQKPDNCLNLHKRNSIDSLVMALENIIKE